MKRLFLASALALGTATASFAATEAEMTRIQQYLPEADIAVWSDAQVEEAITIITSTESRSEIVGRLRALHDGAEYQVRAADISEAEEVQLQEYVGDIDFSMYPQATIDAALNVANSEMSSNDREGRIRQLLSVDATRSADPARLTASEAALIQQYAPDADLAALSEAEANTALSIIYSTENESDISARVQAVLMQ
ncbi:hypothetical protein [Roseivivax sp. CAU 1761]